METTLPPWLNGHVNGAMAVPCGAMESMSVFEKPIALPSLSSRMAYTVTDDSGTSALF